MSILGHSVSLHCVSTSTALVECRSLHTPSAGKSQLKVNSTQVSSPRDKSLNDDDAPLDRKRKREKERDEGKLKDC